VGVAHDLASEGPVVSQLASGKACRHTRGLMYATECRLAGALAARA